MKAVLVVTVVLMSCGGQDAPPCTVTDGGDGTKLLVCPDGTQVTVSDGADGANGSDGVDNHIVSSISCRYELPSTGVEFNYQAVVLASGDVWVAATLVNGGDQASGSHAYAAGDAAAATAPVTMTTDTRTDEADRGWTVEASRVTRVSTVTCDTVGCGGTVFSYDAPASACQVTTY